LKLRCTILNILNNYLPFQLELLQVHCICLPWFHIFDIVHFSMFLCKSSGTGHEHLLCLHVVSYFLNIEFNLFLRQGLYQKSLSWPISIRDVVVSISKDLCLRATAGTSHVDATRAPRQLGLLCLHPPIVWSHHSSSIIIFSMVDRQNDDRWAMRSGGKRTAAINIRKFKMYKEGQNGIIVPEP
jgi:hypothetical protein